MSIFSQEAPNQAVPSATIKRTTVVTKAIGNHCIARLDYKG